MIPTMLSDHFSLDEATTTSHREINNTELTAAQLSTLQRCAVKLEKVRAILGFPLHVNSWYRCLALNRSLGSKDTSDHVKCQAVDFIAPQYGDCLDISRRLIANASLIGYKQLILEHTWVHISWELEIPNVSPKLEVLSLLSGGHYALGLTDLNGKILA